MPADGNQLETGRWMPFINNVLAAATALQKSFADLLWSGMHLPALPNVSYASASLADPARGSDIRRQPDPPASGQESIWRCTRPAKGEANSRHVHVENTGAYPLSAFAVLTGHVAFYAGQFDLCMVDGKRVRPQASGFNYGWIPDNLAAPFKGATGSVGW